MDMLWLQMRLLIFFARLKPWKSFLFNLNYMTIIFSEVFSVSTYIN